MGDRDGAGSVPVRDPQLKKWLKVVMAMLVMVLAVSVIISAYLVLSGGSSENENGAFAFAEFPVAEIDEIAIASKSIQKFSTNDSAYEIIASSEYQSSKVRSCFDLDSENVKSSVSDKENVYFIDSRISGVEGSSARKQSIEVSCDYSVLDIASLSVGETNVFDMLWKTEDEDTPASPDILGVWGFDLSEDDILMMYTQEISALSESKKVILGELPVYYMGEGAGPTELRIPLLVMTDSKFFPDMDYANRAWGDMDYEFGIICVTPSCSEVKFESPE